MLLFINPQWVDRYSYIDLSHYPFPDVSGNCVHKYISKAALRFNIDFRNVEITPRLHKFLDSHRA